MQWTNLKAWTHGHGTGGCENWLVPWELFGCRLGLLAAIGLDRELWVICNVNRKSPFAVDSCPGTRSGRYREYEGTKIHGTFPGFCFFPSFVDMHDSEESPNKHEDEAVRENFPAAQSKICSELSE
jgi:hypothetical protein